MSNSYTKDNVHEIIFGKNNLTSSSPVTKQINNFKSAISNVAAIRGDIMAPKKENPQEKIISNECIHQEKFLKVTPKCRVFTYQNNNQKIIFDSTEKTKRYHLTSKRVRPKRKPQKKLLPIASGSKTCHRYFLVAPSAKDARANPARGNPSAKDIRVNPAKGSKASNKK